MWVDVVFAFGFLLIVIAVWTGNSVYSDLVRVSYLSFFLFLGLALFSVCASFYWTLSSPHRLVVFDFAVHSAAQLREVSKVLCFRLSHDRLGFVLPCRFLYSCLLPFCPESVRIAISRTFVVFWFIPLFVRDHPIIRFCDHGLTHSFPLCLNPSLVFPPSTFAPAFTSMFPTFRTAYPPRSRRACDSPKAHPTSLLLSCSSPWLHFFTWTLSAFRTCTVCSATIIPGFSYGSETLCLLVHRTVRCSCFVLHSVFPPATFLML